MSNVYIHCFLFCDYGIVSYCAYLQAQVETDITRFFDDDRRNVTTQLVKQVFVKYNTPLPSLSSAEILICNLTDVPKFFLIEFIATVHNTYKSVCSLARFRCINIA